MFYNNFEKICELRGLKPNPVAIACGGTKSSCGSWKNGSIPNSNIVAQISEYLNVSTDYLLLGKENIDTLSDKDKELLDLFHQLPDKEQQRFIGRCEEIVSRMNEPTTKRSQIQIVSMPIAVVPAGADATISVPFESDDNFINTDFPTDKISIGADCGVRIKGDSMQPDYPDGSIVWVKTTKNIEYGDLVIVILNGSPLFKIFEKDGLHSINCEKHKVIPVTESDSLECFGKVIGIYEKENSDVPAQQSYLVAARSSDKHFPKSVQGDISCLINAKNSADEY